MSIAMSLASKKLQQILDSRDNPDMTSLKEIWSLLVEVDSEKNKSSDLESSKYILLVYTFIIIDVVLLCVPSSPIFILDHMLYACIYIYNYVQGMFFSSFFIVLLYTMIKVTDEI